MKALEIGPRPGKPTNPEWDTMDILPSLNVTYVQDLRKPMPSELYNKYDLVYMSHVLEHVPWHEAVKVLDEIYNILIPNGVLEVWVPDFEKVVQMYLEKRIPDAWKQFNKERDPMKWVLGRLFAYDKSGFSDFFHRGAFDFEHLTKCFKQAGFREVQRLEKPRGYDHGFINLGVSGKK